MSLWRQLRNGLRNLRHGDRDAADEVAHYLDEETREGVSRGLTETEARRAARVAMGGETQAREQVRGYGWERTVEAFVADMRYAWRGVRHNPGFSLIAIITLAIGIGGATAIFSTVNPVLFDSLPYPEAGRVRVIAEHFPDGSRGTPTFGMYRGLTEGTRSFETFAVYRPWSAALVGGERPERIEGQRVSWEYFQVLRVQPLRGRDFTDADDRPGSARIVILSDKLWRERFAADPSIIGRDITLDDTGYRVVGVLPAGFENVTAPSAQLWTTLRYDMTDGRAWGRHLGMIARLRNGVEPEAAAAELNTVGPRVVREQNPPTYGDNVRWSAPSLQEDLTRSVRPALLALAGAVALVLLLACVNVTNLMLARSVRRSGEFALRTALGAGRGRLVRQVLAESLLLALLAGAVGVLVAALGVRGVIALSPAELPRVAAIGVNPASLVFAFVLTALAGLAFGILPALQAGGREGGTLSVGSARTVAPGHHRVRSALVVAQVSLALVLLTGSGLLLRSMQRLLSEPPGFDPGNALTVQVQASRIRFADPTATVQFFENSVEAIRRVPGVEDAASTSQLPLSGDDEMYGIHLEPGFAERSQSDGSGYRYAVSANYMKVMGIPLRAGRLFEAEDRASAPPVAILSETFAGQLFPGVDPIGQHLRVGPPDGPRYTVVGIVGDVKQLSLAGGAPNAVYIPTGQWQFQDNVVSLVVRGTGNVTALLPSIRSAIWSVDADQPITRVATLAELLATTAAERRFALVIFQLFAVAALLLTAVGIYGMMSGSVAERTREIGVRSAIGATRGQVLGMVLGQGVRLTLLGVGIGLVGAGIGSRLIEAMLYNVSRLDAVTYLGVAVVLMGVSLLACATPAWRAARIDPAITLKNG